MKYETQIVSVCLYANLVHWMAEAPGPLARARRLRQAPGAGIRGHVIDTPHVALGSATALPFRVVGKLVGPGHWPDVIPDGRLYVGNDAMGEAKTILAFLIRARAVRDRRHGDYLDVVVAHVGRKPMPDDGVVEEWPVLEERYDGIG